MEEIDGTLLHLLLVPPPGEPVAAASHPGGQIPPIMCFAHQSSNSVFNSFLINRGKGMRSNLLVLKVMVLASSTQYQADLAVLKSTVFASSTHYQGEVFPTRLYVKCKGKGGHASLFHPKWRFGRSRGSHPKRLPPPESSMQCYSHNRS